LSYFLKISYTRIANVSQTIWFLLTGTACGKNSLFLLFRYNPCHSLILTETTVLTNWNYQQTHFVTSAPDIRHLPADTGIEVAFAGRSNAGNPAP
jgi:hypothetical protein